MNLADAIVYATDETIKLIKKCAWTKNFSVAGINQGFCDQWVQLVLDNLDENIAALGWWIDNDHRLNDDEREDIVHCVLWCEGSFYDCLNVDGKSDPLDLIYNNPPQDVADKIEEIKNRGNPPNLWDDATTRQII